MRGCHHSDDGSRHLEFPECLKFSSINSSNSHAVFAFDEIETESSSIGQ